VRIGIFQKLNSVQVQSAMTNRPTHSNRFFASGWKEFDFDLRSQRDICYGKNAHANVAEIDAESIQRGSSGEYLHRSI